MWRVFSVARTVRVTTVAVSAGKNNRGGGGGGCVQAGEEAAARRREKKCTTLVSPPMLSDNVLLLDVSRVPYKRGSRERKSTARRRHNFSASGRSGRLKGRGFREDRPQGGDVNTLSATSCGRKRDKRRAAASRKKPQPQVRKTRSGHTHATRRPPRLTIPGQDSLCALSCD